MFYKINLFDTSIKIEEDELEKAIYVHLTGKVGMFKNGSVTGTFIASVQPDYYRLMGWNDGWKLGAEEWREIGFDKNCKKARLAFEQKKQRVEYLIGKGQVELIGKNVPIPELETGKGGEVSDAVKLLSDKFKI